jgi:hypothetical protein
MVTPFENTTYGTGELPGKTLLNQFVREFEQGHISSFSLGIDWFDYWVLGLDDHLDDQNI